MDEDFSLFVEDFNRNVRTRAESNNYEMEEAFTEEMCDALVEYGDIDDYLMCSWLDKNIGARVDAYHLDDDCETINLVINLWKDWDGKDIADGRLTNSEIDSAVKRLTNFLLRSSTGKLPGVRIDAGHPANDLAKLIFELKELNSARLIVISDGKAPNREGKISQEEGIEISVSYWDIQRLYNRQKTGEREGITIDFNDYGGPIPCVSMKSANGYYTTYLAFVSGEMLADLYEHHKTRLLEMNVRVFLSQRVKVNQGIRDTIRTSPSMFGAYNNGITVYANKLTTDIQDDGNMSLSVVEDFQIVNGGQTTASLYHTRKTYKIPLDDIFVQMKIMEIHESAKPRDMDESISLSQHLVPKIGKFSNTQNKIQMSDLSANDPPHPDIHAISLKLPASDPTGGTRETYWFYEKSRGSWDEKRRLDAKTTAQRRVYDTKYPRNQRFDKGQFSKVWYSHHQKPHIVSLGPQKCFAHFNSNLLKEEIKIAKDDPAYWPNYFRKTVGLLIIWRNLEKEIKRRIREGIYESYAQNLTAYTISLFANQTGGKINLNHFWEKQILSETILEYLLSLCDVVHEHIVNTPSGISHVPEWCKKEDCWKELLKIQISSKPPKEVKDLKQNKSKGAKPKKSDAEIAVKWCVEKGAQSWKDLASFLKNGDLMAGKHRSQAFNMGRTIEQSRTPSTALAIPCKKIWESAELSYNWKD